DGADDIQQAGDAGRQGQVDDVAVGRQGIGGVDDEQLVGLPEFGQEGADRGVEDAALFHRTYPLTSRAAGPTERIPASRVPSPAPIDGSSSAPGNAAWRWGVASPETPWSITMGAASLPPSRAGRAGRGPGKGLPAGRMRPRRLTSRELRRRRRRAGRAG